MTAMRFLPGEEILRRSFCVLAYIFGLLEPRVLRSIEPLEKYLCFLLKIAGSQFSSILFGLLFID